MLQKTIKIKLSKWYMTTTKKMIYDNNKENDIWQQQRKWYMTTTKKMMYDNKENDIWQQQRKWYMTTTKKMRSELPKRNFNGQEQIQIKIQNLKKTYKKEKNSQV